MIRVAAFATHPIQYQAPVWRAMACAPDINLTVYYLTDWGARPAYDPDFQWKVAWDVPLLQGYKHEFVASRRDNSDPNDITLCLPAKPSSWPPYDVSLIAGYTHMFERQLIRAARRDGKRIVMRGEFAEAGRRRGFLKRITRRAYLQWFYRHVDAFCYPGIEGRRHLEMFQVPSHRLFYSPYCVDSEFFEAQRRTHNRKQSRAALGVGEEEFAVLFVGKLVDRKQPKLLLNALGRLSRSSRVALILVGDGPQRQEVVQLGQDLLGSRFYFHGFANQTELGRFYAAADAFCLPSSYETWGLVVNEAMQFGLPVIVSDNVACRHDLVVEGTTGFTFPSGDATALANRIEILVRDPEKRRGMAEAAHSVIEGHSVSRCTAGVLAAIRSVV